MFLYKSIVKDFVLIMDCIGKIVTYTRKAASIFRQLPNTSAERVRLEQEIDEFAGATLLASINRVKATQRINFLGVDPFDTFVGDIKEELKPAREAIRKYIHKQINPINSQNMQEIKGKSLDYCDRVLPELRPLIEQCDTPENLFNNVKDYLFERLDIKQTKDFEAFINQRNKKNIPLDQIDVDLRTIIENSVREFKEASDIFTPKSTNPEVIAIEQEIKALGVEDINCSDDLSRAKDIKIAVEQLKKAGIPIPTSITVTGIIHRHIGGFCTNQASVLNGRSSIYLKHSAEDAMEPIIIKKVLPLAFKTQAFLNGPKEFQKKYRLTVKAAMLMGHATKNPRHVIYHEVGHSIQPFSISLGEKEMTAVDKSIAHRTSLNAERGYEEIVPEFLTILMDGFERGKKPKSVLTKEQIKLYLSLGGILPQV